MTATSGAVAPDRIEHDCDGGRRRSVEDGRPDRVHATSQTLREYGGREGDQRDEHQDHVDHRERAVRTVDQGEETVMLDPHDPDREEAHQIANKLRQLAEEGPPQVSFGVGSRIASTSKVMAIAKTPSAKWLESACLGPRYGRASATGQ